MNGALLMAVGVAIVGLCRVCTWNVVLAHGEDQSYGLAPLGGGTPVAVGLVVLMRGWSIFLEATPQRANLAKAVRTMSEGVTRLGVGTPLMWIAGRGLILLIWSDEKGGRYRPLDTGSAVAIGFALLFLVLGSWLSAVGVRRIIRVRFKHY
jgi:hypothetical protein